MTTPSEIRLPCLDSPEWGIGSTAVSSQPFNLLLWRPAWGCVTLSLHLPLAAAWGPQPGPFSQEEHREGEGAASKVAGQQMEGSGARVGIRAPRCVYWLPVAPGQPAELWGSNLNSSQNESQWHPSQTSCCLELWEPQRSLWISLNEPLAHTNDPLSERPAWLKQGKWTHRDLVGVLLSDQSHIFYSLFCGEEGSRNTRQF